MFADPEAGARRRTAELLARCRSDYGLFNTAILGRPPFWWRQEEIARSVIDYYETVVYSGNSIGKDFLIGTLVPAWLYTRQNSLVIVTGPSQSLLGSVTWKECRKAINNSRFPLGAKLSQGIKTSPHTIRVDDSGEGWQALGLSTNSVERASGQHAKDLLVIVEEASGVEDDQWEAIDGLKYTTLLAVMNPIRSRCRAVEMVKRAEKHKSDGVPKHLATNAIRVPSTDSPHAHLDHSDFGLADKTWIDTKRRDYGPNSLWVRAHIDAKIPDADSEALIPEGWYDFAASPHVARRFPPGDPRAGRRRTACDLGEGVGRDSGCVGTCDDLGILDFAASAAMGLPEAAAEAARQRSRWQVADQDISYDRGGIGKNFPNFLSRFGIKNATGYVGEGRAMSSEFTNIRTEAAWAFRNRLDPDWCPNPLYPAVKQPPFALKVPEPYWARLRLELKALTYHLVGRQTALIKKEDLTEALGHSPDFVDMLIQLFVPRQS